MKTRVGEFLNHIKVCVSILYRFVDYDFIVYPTVATPSSICLEPYCLISSLASSNERVASIIKGDKSSIMFSWLFSYQINVSRSIDSHNSISIRKNNQNLIRPPSKPMII